jgi:hypothetical protein
VGSPLSPFTFSPDARVGLFVTNPDPSSDSSPDTIFGLVETKPDQFSKSSPAARVGLLATNPNTSSDTSSDSSPDSARLAGIRGSLKRKSFQTMVRSALHDAESPTMESPRVVFAPDRGFAGQAGDGISHRADAAVVKRRKLMTLGRGSGKRRASKPWTEEVAVPKEMVSIADRVKRWAAGQLQQPIKSQQISTAENRPPSPDKARRSSSKTQKWARSASIVEPRHKWGCDLFTSPRPATTSPLLVYPKAPPKFKSLLSPDSSPEPIPPHLRTTEARFFFFDDKPPLLPLYDYVIPGLPVTPQDFPTVDIRISSVSTSPTTSDVAASLPTNTQGQKTNSPIRTSPKVVRFDASKWATEGWPKDMPSPTPAPVLPAKDQHAAMIADMTAGSSMPRCLTTN